MPKDNILRVCYLSFKKVKQTQDFSKNFEILLCLSEGNLIVTTLPITSKISLVRVSLFRFLDKSRSSSKSCNARDVESCRGRFSSLSSSETRFLF